MSLPLPNSEVLAHLDDILGAPAGRRVGVLGLGIAGRAMALLLARRGAHVVGADAKKELASAAELQAAGLELRLGEIGAGTFADVEALVISPGADPRQAAVQAVLGRGLPVIGELELAGKIPARVIGITGTNGKSTTTSLVGALVRAAGLSAFVGGNLGDPIAGWLASNTPADVAVLELSSFQLETAYRFRADVAIMLNITPDHLDRYDSVAAYARTKERLLANMAKDGIAILSYDDATVREMAKATPAKIWWFSTRGAAIPGDGAVLRGDEMVTQGEPSDLGTMSLAHPRLFGRHNRENAIASLLAVRALGVLAREALAKGYVGFSGLEHRLELAGCVGGVRYINDSKATNDDAVAIALAAIDDPIVLMLGGRSKHGGYEGVRRNLGQKVHTILAYGEARAEIAEAFRDHPGLIVKTTIAEAFEAAVARARPGDVVLLSPACASYDEFKDYTQRGRVFKEWVLALGNNRGARP